MMLIYFCSYENTSGDSAMTFHEFCSSKPGMSGTSFEISPGANVLADAWDVQAAALVTRRTRRNILDLHIPDIFGAFCERVSTYCKVICVQVTITEEVHFLSFLRHGSLYILIILRPRALPLSIFFYEDQLISYSSQIHLHTKALSIVVPSHNHVYCMLLRYLRNHNNTKGYVKGQIIVSEINTAGEIRETSYIGLFHLVVNKAIAERFKKVNIGPRNLFNFTLTQAPSLDLVE